MTVPIELLYNRSHEWARVEGDTVVVGITHYAQDQLGEVVYVELPEVGATLAKDTAFGVVESVKAASDLYMPMGGKIVEVNESLDDEPENVNEDPYGAGWIAEIKLPSIIR